MLITHSDTRLPADLEAVVTASGLRMTHAREVLLRALHALNEPTSGEALYRLIVKGRQRVSRSTIYRTLSDFEHAGLVCREAKTLPGSQVVYTIVKLKQLPRDSGAYDLNARDIAKEAVSHGEFWKAQQVHGEGVWDVRNIFASCSSAFIQVAGSKALAERVANALNGDVSDEHLGGAFPPA